MSSLWSTALISAFIAPASLASQQSHNVTPHQGIAEVTWIRDFPGWQRVSMIGDWIVAGQSVSDKPGYFHFYAHNTQTDQDYELGQFNQWRSISETALIVRDGQSSWLMEFDDSQQKFVQHDLPNLPLDSTDWSAFWIDNDPYVHWTKPVGHGAALHITHHLRNGHQPSRFFSVGNRKASVNGPFIVRQDDSTIQFTDVRTGYDSAVITLGHPIKYMVLSPGKEFALIKLKNENHPLILLDTHTQLDQKHIVQGSENVRDLLWADHDLFAFTKRGNIGLDPKLRSVKDPNTDLNDTRGSIKRDEWNVGSKLSIRDIFNQKSILKPGWVVSGEVRAQLKWT